MSWHVGQEVRRLTVGRQKWLVVGAVAIITEELPAAYRVVSVGGISDHYVKTDKNRMDRCWAPATPMEVISEWVDLVRGTA